MRDYKIIIPIGAQLPQVGSVIRTTDKDFADRQVMVKVAAINGITWGTAPDREDGDKPKVAGVFVDLYGAPYPEIILTKEQQRKQSKHFVVFDQASGEAKACYSNSDYVREISLKGCPACARKKAAATEPKESIGTSIAEVGAILASRHINITGCISWEEVIERVTTHYDERPLFCPDCPSKLVCNSNPIVTCYWWGKKTGGTHEQESTTETGPTD